MIVVFGSSNAFGRDVSEMEMMVLAGTVFVVSVLLVLVYKLARGWDDMDKDDFGASMLPLHAPRATNRWVSSRKTHFGRLGTIQENEIFSFSSKMRVWCRPGMVSSPSPPRYVRTMDASVNIQPPLPHSSDPHLARHLEFGAPS